MTEYFNITIIQVVLVNESSAPPPKIREGFSYVFCRIGENDNPYGVIHFSNQEVSLVKERLISVIHTITGFVYTVGSIDTRESRGFVSLCGEVSRNVSTSSC